MNKSVLLLAIVISLFTTAQAQVINLNELKQLRTMPISKVQQTLFNKGYSLYKTWKNEDLKLDSVIYQNSRGQILGTINFKKHKNNRIFLESSEVAFYEQILQELRDADYRLINTEVGQQNSLTNSYILPDTDELVQIIISNDPTILKKGNQYRLLIRLKENSGLKKRILGNY
ncbi:hypothetical protein GQF61_07260 [Sphingobacterium sp. DK4209]|uniref:Uncharacterized protein n=1 Tax=Sphingobacterium zhuxiongii TaxID=2662364 RepID=A0A5Q0QIJ0_9SPHI|nr:MULTISPECIES: hypothetical protein [unclassified Sphingobacterium]MVZ65651.1 hypothetical protein [Sphingobacterium sp. DK4209]QGA27772.1 hypothetical protein GFH32_16230 [Sphingobacterium sp. dk4302]